MRIALVLTVVLAFSLTGCTPEGPSVLPQPVPSSTPIFASDEEALAAAEEAYGAYQAAEDAILNGGGLQPELLDGLAVGEIYQSGLSTAAEFKEAGYRSSGTTTFTIRGLQQYSPFASGGVAILSAYVCLNLSGVDVSDANGVSIVEDTRPDLQGFEVSFNLSDADQLLVATRDKWEGAGVCVEQ